MRPEALRSASLAAASATSMARTSPAADAEADQPVLAHANGRRRPARHSGDNATLHLKLPIPHAPEAERALLGTLLLAPHHLPMARDLVRARDFYQEANAHIFRCMCSLHDSHSSIDTVFVAEELRRVGLLAGCGDLHYLISLTDVIPTVHYARAYAALIRERSRRRQILLGLVRLLQKLVGAPLTQVP